MRRKKYRQMEDIQVLDCTKAEKPQTSEVYDQDEDTSRRSAALI